MRSRIDGGWIVGWTVGLLLLLGAPVLWGWLHPPEGWQLYRNWAYGGDYPQYRSAMLQGYDGAWLIVNRFTPEPHRPILQYPLYVLLGHIARLFHWPLELPYVLASALAVGVLVFALERWAAAFLRDLHTRRLAFLLSLSVGPGWIIAMLRALAPRAAFLLRYRDAFNRQEVNTFLLFDAAPHLPLALALLLGITASFYRYELRGTSTSIWRSSGEGEVPTWFRALLYSLGVVLIALLNPFSLPPLLLLLGLAWLWRCWRDRRLYWQGATLLGAMGAVALPFVVYNLLIFSRDPFWGRAYGSQNFQVSFPPDVVLMGYGLMGVAALLGSFRERQTPSVQFLAYWSLSLWLLGYLPLPYQRRFSLGLSPALAVLAAGEVQRWLTWLREVAVRRLVGGRLIRIVGLAMLILLLWGENAIFYAAYVDSYLGRGPEPRYMFQPRALVAAVASVEESDGAGVVILTCEELGNILAGEIHGRVVLGHAGATLDVHRRREQVAAFFAGAMSEETQRGFLRRHRVTHILTAQVETLTCGPDYVPPPGWERLFARRGIVVWHTIADGRP